MPIIYSLLDNDLYKFTMMQAVLHNYPATIVEYKFKSRSALPLIPTGTKKHEFVSQLETEIENLCLLRLTGEELNYLSTIPYIKPDFIEYLRMFKLNRAHVSISFDKDGELDIRVKGPWLNTILFEVPILAIVSEIVSRCGQYGYDYMNACDKLDKKVEFLISETRYGAYKGLKFADFGTRRRFSREFHEYAIKRLMDKIPDMVAGTSNMMLAKRHFITPIGTMAHEWIQAHQQLGVRVVDSQKQALEVWAHEYRGELGIALSDCIGFKAFINDFDKYFAKLFDGCRHDSGDPYDWCEDLIEHYKKLKIDPKTKLAVFSDGLDFKKMLSLHKSFSSMINVGFGIGTYLTNDTGNQAPQIVMKLINVDGQPVAKLSDSPGKLMCTDDQYVEYLKMVFNIKE